MQSYNHAPKKEVKRRHSLNASKARKRRFPGRRSPTSRSLRLTPAAPQHAAGASSDPLRSRVRHVQTGASLNALFLLLASCRRWRDHDRRVCGPCVCYLTHARAKRALLRVYVPQSAREARACKGHDVRAAGMARSLHTSLLQYKKDMSHTPLTPYPP